MKVYLVTRGTELVHVCDSEEFAQEKANKYNETFKRGKRAEVTPVTVMTRENER